MKKIAIFIVAATMALAAVPGCQPSDGVDPQDEPTGQAPNGPGVIFSFNANNAPAFLDNNLAATNAVSATFATSGGFLAPIPENGAFSAEVGADASLLAGVGFGLYPNPDIRGPGVAWEGADRFRSQLAANIVLNGPGDAVKFCRTAATTCVTFMLDAAGNGVAVLTIAANVPDIEIGEISPGISAAIRGTGANGLTITPANPLALSAAFDATAGAPFDVSWTIARGGSENSLDYAVSVNGTEIASSNTLVDLVGAIPNTGGVAMQFDSLPSNGDPLSIDYSYEFDGTTPNFSNILGSGVNLSPQLGLIRTPLFVYPTLDPELEVLTLSGNAGTKHAVQAADAVLGTAVGIPGAAPQTTVLSVAFNGDDFAGTGLAGNIDQGVAGGGFYPSPSLCYGGVFSQLKASVEAGAQRVVRQQMYAPIANGVAGADDAAALPALAAALGQTYTQIANPADFIAIGTDYADSNLATAITTSAGATYTVTLTNTTGQTFVAEMNNIIAVAQANSVPVPATLLALQAGLTTPNGIQETYDGQVDAIVKDLILGRNDTGQNPAPGIPGLAGACLWGVPPSPEVPAVTATLTGNLATDTPAFDAVPARDAIAPAREIGAESINTLVLGIYGNFIGQAFGPTVPASNFSLSMKVGDTATSTPPAVSTIVISQ